MDLDSLRERLRNLDHQILTLASRRQEIAVAIGREKLQAGLPTRDYRQEKDVVQRARDSAAELGLPPALAERITLALIEASLTVQERDKVSRHAGGNGRRVLVIGGAGRMGGWMVGFLASQGFEVEIADPSGAAPGFAHRDDWRTGALDHDIIVVAAPLRTSNGILLEMAASPPPGVVLDIGSLKGPLREGLLALAETGARVASIHPLFGPGTELLSHRHIVFVDLGSPQATRQAKELFASTLAVPVDMDLEAHDRFMAYVLGLSHALSIAFVDALANSGATAPRLAGLSSTTFDAQLAIAETVSRENPSLYFEIQSLNGYGPDALTAAIEALDRVRSIVKSGDEDAFVGLMEKGRAYLDQRGAR